MTLNLASMHGFVVQEISSTRSLKESMDRIIAKCAKGRPHEDWKELAALPYENLDELREWIETLFGEVPPKRKLAALWFGLCNPIYSGTAVADIYVSGSADFNPSPVDNSWAADPDWLPESSCAHSSLLAELYRIAYRKEGLGNDAEYPLCLAYGGLAIRDLLRSLDPLLILGNSNSLGVAVGFDSGDFLLVGKLSKSGLQAI